MGKNLSPATQIGDRYGGLVVVATAEANRHGHARFVCRCDCGVVVTVTANAIRRGHTLSCGCRRREAAKKRATHGMSSSREFAIWAGMIARCRNPHMTSYADYGGRGVSVCDRWLSFAAFFEDMGPRPGPKHSVDRINPDGNYEPQNCRWATPLEQATNRRRTRRVLYRGKFIALTEAVRMAGNVIHPQAAWRRITASGWDVAQALETPSSALNPKPYRYRLWA